MATTNPDAWRLQSGSNKQGSSGFLTEWPSTDPEHMATIRAVSPGEMLTAEETLFHEKAREVYASRLQMGVAREQARKDLPLSTYTEAYWKIDLLNLLKFLHLRMDSHAQLEIREFATVIGEQIVAPLFPLVWAAFADYWQNSVSLSARDQYVLRSLSQHHRPIAGYSQSQFMECQFPAWQEQQRCRERDECLEKLRRLGIVAAEQQEPQT